MATTSLWVETYRPSTLDGYVFTNSTQQTQINQWIAQQSIPHILLSGSAGVGKTTLAKILFTELNIDSLDILEINASRERGIDAMRDRITTFIQMIPFGDFKVVLLDEADYLTRDAQASLRGIMEEYSDNARFILTCNYPNKIIPAIHSRCQGFHIDKVDQVEFTARIATILINENIEFELDTLDTYIQATYPDLRKCINTVQMNSLNGTLISATANESNSSDYKIEMVELFKSGKIDAARKLVCSQARPDEMEEIYRWLYSNLDYLGTTEKQQTNAILIIKQGLLDHALIADAEINLAAVLIRLARNLES